MSNNESTVPTASAGTWRVTNYSVVEASDRAASWVRCSVEGQENAIVRLSPLDPTSKQAARTAVVGSRPEYGPDSCELGPVRAGEYNLSVEGLDLSVDLWLDGNASAAVAFAPADMVVPVEPSEKPPHVLLLGQLMVHRGNFLALTRYVARFGAVVTFDPEEAAQAEHVILIGGAHLVGAEVEQDLRQAGVRVERVEGDIATQLDRATEAGIPFLTN